MIWHYLTLKWPKRGFSRDLTTVFRVFYHYRVVFFFTGVLCNCHPLGYASFGLKNQKNKNKNKNKKQKTKTKNTETFIREPPFGTNGTAHVKNKKQMNHEIKKFLPM